MLKGAVSMRRQSGPAFRCVLGRVIPGPEGREDPATHRGGVDDPAHARRPHVRQDELGEVGEAEQVDLELVSRVSSGMSSTVP